MNENYLNNFLGGRIASLSRACDMVCIGFNLSNSNEIYIHIQSFFRILKDNMIIVSSQDMCRRGSNCKDNEEFNWDVPGQTRYDDSLNEHIGTLIGSVVVDVKQETNGDLVLFFNNDVVLQIFIDTVEIEEKYRIFSDTDGIVVDSRGRCESDR